MTETPKVNRVLLVEDRLSTQRWLADSVGQAYTDARVDTADNLAQARALLSSALNLALIDLGLPDGSGIELITELVSDYPQCLPVVVTVYDDDEHLFAALRAGARGYLLKDQSQADIVRMLQGLLRGDSPLSPGIASKLLAVFRDSATDEGPGETLTDREKDVLTLIAKGYSVVRTGETLKISRNTVAFHSKNIYQKLRINNRAEASLEAARLGLVKTRL